MSVPNSQTVAPKFPPLLKGQGSSEHCGLEAWRALTEGVWSTTAPGHEWDGTGHRLVVQEDMAATSGAGIGCSPADEEQQGCQLPWMPLLQKHLQPWAHNFSKNKQINKEPHGRLREEDAGEPDDLFWKLPSEGQDFPVERYLRVTAEQSPHLANKGGRNKRIRTWPFSNPDELWIQQWPPVSSSWQEHTQHLWNSPAQKST